MITQLFSQTDILTNCLLYGTICLAAGLIAAWLFRRSPARAHQVLLLAMIAAVVVPAMSTLVGHYEIGIFSVKVAPAQADEAIATIMPELVMPVTTKFAEPVLQYDLAAVEHLGQSVHVILRSPRVPLPSEFDRTVTEQGILASSPVVAAVDGQKFRTQAQSQEGLGIVRGEFL